MLRNPGFEVDWAEESSHACLIVPADGAPYQTEIGNIFTPPGWLTFFYHDPQPDPTNGWDQPEVRDAWREYDERRVRTGEKGILLFTFHRRHVAGFMQQVAVTPGATYRLTAYAHAWSNHIDGPHKDDPWWSEGAEWAPYNEGHEYVGAKNWYLQGETGDSNWTNFTFKVGVDPTGGMHPFEGVTWGQGIHVYNAYSEPVPSIEFIAESDTITIFLRSVTKWAFKHNDAYWDDVELTIVEEPPTPPPPEGCRLPVLVPYLRTIRDTIDDLIEEIENVELPPTTTTTASTTTVSTTTTLLPPQMDETRIGLHLQGGEPGVSEYYAVTKSTILKTFWMQGWELLSGSLDSAFVFRQYVEHPGGFLWHEDGPEAGAKAFVDTFSSGLVTEAEKADRLIWVESLNEEYSHDEKHVLRSVAFDSAFIQIVHALHPNVRAVVFNGPVGNPHESQFWLLVSLAEVAMEYGAAFGLHSYWGANKNYTYLQSWWPWLAGRFTEVNKVLNAYGIYGMKWLIGEGGAVGAYVVTDLRGDKRVAAEMLIAAKGMPKAAQMQADIRVAFGGQRVQIVSRPKAAAQADAISQDEHIILLPDSGWRNEDCYDGDWQRYEGDIRLWQSLVQEYDASLTLFTTNGPGWGSFQIGQAQIECLQQVL